MKPVAGLKIERALMVSIVGPGSAPLRVAANQKACLPKDRRCRTILPILLGDLLQDIRSYTMRTSMNFLLWTTHVTAEHFPILAKLKRTGFDGVEIPVFEGDAAHFKTIRQELDKQGLKCTTVTVLTPEANPISPDAAVRKAAVD